MPSAQEPLPFEVVVVPDLHGRLDALEAILADSGFVGAKGQLRKTALHLVQLGDIVDRGTQVRACVERLMALQTAAPDRVHVLKGNHEALLVDSYTDPRTKMMWLANGGSATLHDYEGRYEAWIAPGGRHHDWLASLPLTFEKHGILFCHAGLGRDRKGLLTEEGLLWDRPPLVRGPYQAVVCGHSPTHSGKVEEKEGVFACDLGLGHGSEKGLEYLRLSIMPKSFTTVVKSIS